MARHKRDEAIKTTDDAKTHQQSPVDLIKREAWRDEEDEPSGSEGSDRVEQPQYFEKPKQPKVLVPPAQLPPDKQPLEFLLFNSERRRDRMEISKLRHDFHRNGLQKERAEVFYQQSWEWANPNMNISLQFFQRVLEQRLKDGFLIVNRFSETSDYFHLIKIIKAEKEPRGSKKEKP